MPACCGISRSREKAPAADRAACPAARPPGGSLSRACAAWQDSSAASDHRGARSAPGGMLKALPLTIRGPRPIDEAIVTRGGVSVKEIDPRTMASKLLPGLYFAGEVMDVDAHTGGFNLHIAFSTGRLAGQSALPVRNPERERKKLSGIRPIPLSFQTGANFRCTISSWTWNGISR